VLSAIRHLGNLGILECCTHVLVRKSVFERDVVVGTAILSVYTKDVNILGKALKFFGQP